MVKTASLHSRTYIYGSEVKRIYTDRTANMYGRKEKQYPLKQKPT